MERKGKAAAVVAALSLSLSLPFSLFSLSAYAETPSQTYTLTSAQTYALFGSTITCEYTAEGTQETGYVPFLKTASAETLNAVTTIGGLYYSPDGVTYGSRTLCWYRLSAPDMVTYSTFNIKFNTSVDLSGVTYLDTAVLPYYPNFDWDTPYGTQNWYWNNEINGVSRVFYPLRRGNTESADYGKYGYTYQSNLASPIIPCFYQGESTSFSFGTCQLFARAYNNGYLIGILCPIISTYEVTGNGGAGDIPSESSGSGSCSGGADLSSVENKLDDIIDQLDQIIQNTAQSSPDSGDANDYHNDKSQNASEMQQGKNYQAQIDSVVNADGGSTPEFENEYTMANEFNSLWTYKDTSGNTQQNTFLIALPIITITIGGLAYVVFGRMK